MDNPLSVGTQAKALAEAGDISVDAAAKLGRFVDSAFGQAISNAVGLVSDRLAYYRFEKAILFKDKVEARLKKKGIDATRFVPVNFGLPILEKASVEDDETLQDKWAALLANAMDPTYVGPITRNFISILADLEPVDVRLLDDIFRDDLGKPKQKNALFQLEDLVKNLAITERDCENSVRNLFRLGLLKPGVVEIDRVAMGGFKATIYKDTELFDTTHLGEDFYKAVTL